MNGLAKLGTDIVNGTVNTSFASEDGKTNMEALYAGLVEINGGEKLDYKRLQAGRVNGLFEIIETILSNTVNNGLAENEFFQRFVDYRNLAEGDENDFFVPDNSLLIVSDMARGSQGVRRQRINKGQNYSVKTSFKGVKAYEELRRLLAGRIDISEFVQKVGESMLQDRLNVAYQTLLGGLSDLPAQFTVTGAYVEDSMFDIIDHVEAATGGTAIIIGTRKALRKITVDTNANGDNAKNDKYAMSYYGTVGGTDVMVIKQSHVVNTFNFAFSEDDLWIVSADTKPVKFVTEGEMIMEVGDMLSNADMTIDVMAGEAYGADIVINDLYGQYRIS